MQVRASEIPNFYGTVFTSGDEPFAFVVEGHSCHITGMTLESAKLDADVRKRCVLTKTNVTGSEEAEAIS